MPVEYYQSSLEHILAELEWLDLLIDNRVQYLRHSQPEIDSLRGLYISENETDELLRRSAGLPVWAENTLDADRASPDSLSAKIAQRSAESLRLGIRLRLVEIEERFQLSPFERNVLLVCLAPELDLRYERLYAYLQDDVTKKRPSVDLALNLLSHSFAEKLENRQRFSPTATLSKNNLVQLFEDPTYPQPPLIARFLKINERIAGYLLGSDEISAPLQAHAQLIKPRYRLEDLFIPDEYKERFVTLAGENCVFYFQGPPGVGKQSTAEAICQAQGRSLIVVDGEGLRNLATDDFRKIIDHAGREARLRDAALYWEGFDRLLVDDQHSQLLYLLNALDELPILVFFAGETAWEPVDGRPAKRFVRVEFHKPTAAERAQLWAKFINAPESEINEVAHKFRFNGGQIRDAAATARNLAFWRDPESGRVNTADLYHASRLHSNQKLAALARKVTPHYRWEDIILPVDRLEQLREVCNSVKYRKRVYEDWGFERKLALGKGLNVLFAGPSGTGKTMAAEIIAGELGLDLYKIDLSTVVSKYIGETEKNLARIFAEAETSNAILFFDEADALFGKRSEVRDAHDRYANIEIAYLLQKMDEYEGMVILATNLRKNMDEAFVRRMHFTVEFPFPNEQDRLRIWDKIFPIETPRGADLDLAYLARKFEITGGNIRNISLAAAFLAAENGAVVKMEHIVHAARREYQKMGKMIMGNELSEYARPDKKN